MKIKLKSVALGQSVNWNFGWEYSWKKENIESQIILKCFNNNKNDKIKVV